ncbi:SAYSvFN domain-containing protein 1 [Cyprinodon tularosa]|uniref:SAYSVFN motif domain containing 1 n=1 Tax=Cyprinodon variegatus TaxID=28743 RepID=A0A3Q2DMW3_CYPVA|nr:PREDICTED: SAYSvFN domain-containing protein 1 [Cyprinodon variegatus]XP_038123534.1 SAYSvFN domain-containing protein 1 [Cyprinodon tularosa]
MEQKLAEFRARRQAVKGTQMSDPSAAQPREKREGDPVVQADNSQQAEGPENNQTATNSSPGRSCSDWMLDSTLGRWLSSRQLVLSNIMLLKVLLWLVLLGLFVELEFGLPFFVISLFYWLYEGLRSPEPRKPGELSAYSVFNPDCQPLLGSLTAEQLEGEMGYRPLANR